MATTPQYPTALPSRFAENGGKRDIPDSTGEHGRASWDQGFPPETQRPLRQGGVAPTRPDFNGILAALSAPLFWAQSGGLWRYDAALGYTAPSIVFHDGNLWWCLRENGPESPYGVQVPGGAPGYWMEFLRFLSQAGGGLSSLGVPVGAIAHFCRASAPEGWFPLNGTMQSFDPNLYPQLYQELGTNVLPDLSGLVIRGHDPHGRYDPDGPYRSMGAVQMDAMQPIQGTFTSDELTAYHNKRVSVTGAFYHQEGSVYSGGKGRADKSAIFGFDSSRVVRTAPETRMRNISLLPCIKHD